MSSVTEMVTEAVTEVISSIGTGDIAYNSELLWIVILGFIVSFVLAFGVGANDVANSFGTSVGAKVLTIRQACILATIFEIAGAVLIGYKVSDTMRKGIIDPSIYNNSNSELMLGNLAALGGSGVWLILATFLKLPISGTHSIVGATIGFSLVAKGTEGVQWSKLGQIVASWFVSPVLSGLMSSALFLAIRKLILRKPAPLEYGLRALPIFYALTLGINVFSIVLDGPSLLYFDRIPWWGTIILSCLIGLLAGMAVQLVMVPRLRRSITEGHRNDEATRAKFAFGGDSGPGSAASSANITPEESRNVSMDNIPYNGVHSELDPANTLHSRQGGKQRKPTEARHKPMRFGFRKSQPKTISLAGEESPFIAETRLDNQGNKGQPNSEQPTPIHGLSPCSSAVPLINAGGVPHATIVKKTMDVENPPTVNVASTLASASVDDPPEVVRLFSFLQIMTASFGAFAHGGNDVSNAIGPLVAIWLIYTEGNVEQRSETPLHILFFGGIGITIGLWVWGRRVIKTVGEDLTKLTSSSGFTIEIGAAFTVLVASKIGVPISTTHCKVGSVVFVGWAQTSRGGVDWALFRNIIFAWAVTVPIAGGLSAAIMYIFQVCNLF
ncbi:sodium-dependent phosphate transporter 1-A-like [Daphnia carinata]|uniref:sodium-dependent phosphate transporter 1-A-like n=1 Tax=Daphnia carinata TaxID=120202 RepID=UPI00257C01F4|nr:sodium-dependent phosphate transporter 1-A-like [Daphnia carinata]